MLERYRQPEASERNPKNWDEPRDLVHAPLPATWRRSSLSSANALVPEDTRQKDAGIPLRAGQAQEMSLPVSLVPLLKSRQEAYRSGLTCPELIDVRKNPL